MSETELEDEIEELLTFEAEYNLKLLRMLLCFGLAFVLVSLIGVVLFVRPEHSWAAFGLIIADYFAWLLMLELKRDVVEARELERDRYRLVLELRYRLIRLKTARLEIVPKVREAAPPDKSVPSRINPAVQEESTGARQIGSIMPDNLQAVAPGRFLVTDEQAEHPALVGISPEYPDPVALWGMSLVRELHEKMASDYEDKKTSDYAFVYGVVTGKAVSGPQWVARGLTLRSFNELIKLLAEAGIVEELGQGKKSRTIYIKNPVQAYLVAYQKHKQA
jgi:hypothetical protein